MTTGIELDTQHLAELHMGVQRFETALRLGSLASRIEADARQLRGEAGALMTEPFVAPEGTCIVVGSTQHEAPLDLQIPDDDEPGEWQTVRVEDWNYLPEILQRSTKSAYYMDDVTFYAESLEYDGDEQAVVAYSHDRACRVVVREERNVLTLLVDTPDGPVFH